MLNDKIWIRIGNISRLNSSKPPTPTTVLNLLHLLVPTLFRTIWRRQRRGYRKRQTEWTCTCMIIPETMWVLLTRRTYQCWLLHSWKQGVKRYSLKSTKPLCGMSSKLFLIATGLTVSYFFYNQLALMQILDLARMYGLLSRVLNGLDPLREKFGQHVRRTGRAAVEKVLPAPGAVNEAGKAESLVSAPRC